VAVGVPRRRLLSCILVLVALAAAVDLVLVSVWGARSPAWSHFWCSPALLHASVRHGGPSGGFAGTLAGFLRALLPHWPHILPIFLALATLVYLRRADARYHAQGGHAGSHAGGHAQG
jgi:hypothetical protein